MVLMKINTLKMMNKKKREDDEKWTKLGVDGSLLTTMDMQSNAKIKSKILNIKKSTEGSKLTNGAKQEGLKCWFYELWDQNENNKLLRWPKVQLSHIYITSWIRFYKQKTSLVSTHHWCKTKLYNAKVYQSISICVSYSKP